MNKYVSPSSYNQVLDCTNKSDFKPSSKIAEWLAYLSSIQTQSKDLYCLADGLCSLICNKLSLPDFVYPAPTWSATRFSISCHLATPCGPCISPSLPHTFRNTFTMWTWSRRHIIDFSLCTKLNSASVMLQPNKDLHATFVLKPSITNAFTSMFNSCSESIACFIRTDSVYALSPAVKWKFIGSFRFFLAPTAIITRAFVATFSVSTPT